MSTALLYLSNERIPGNSACAIQQVNMCAAFSRSSLPVTLVRPWYWSIRRSGLAEVQRFYGLVAGFSIVTLPSLLDLSRPEKQRRWTIPLLGGFSLMLSAAFYLAFRFIKSPGRQTLIIYSRNVNATAVALWLRFLVRKKKLPVIYEAHSVLQQPEWLFRYVLRHCDLVVAISQALGHDLAPWCGNIKVLPDAAPQEYLSSSTMTQAQARSALALPDRFKKVVVYTGSLKPGKGSSIFLQAATQMSEEVLFILVGGDSSRPPAGHSGAHLLCVGFVAPAQVRLYQYAADVLVLPNTREGSIYRYTSPLKLYEYMAANRPMVASDLPVLREVLQDGVNALLTPPGDVGALVAAITRLLADEELARRLAGNAYRQVASCTWELRAEQIINQVKTLC